MVQGMASLQAPPALTRSSGITVSAMVFLCQSLSSTQSRLRGVVAVVVVVLLLLLLVAGSWRFCESRKAVLASNIAHCLTDGAGLSASLST